MNYSEITELIDENVIESQPDLEIVRDKINSLIDAGFLKKENTNEYIFKDQVTWEIVYETLLYAERRHLHELIASHIEKNKENNIELYSAKLVYHYEKAENNKKTVFYASMAGDRAFSLFAVDDAIEFYGKAMESLKLIKKYSQVDLSMLLEKKADVIESTGIYQDAISLYKESIDACEGKISSRNTSLPWKPNIKKRMSILNHKLSVAYERSLQYEKSLQCLDTSEKQLPPRPGDLPVKITATKSVVYFRKYEFDKAMDTAKQSLLLAKKRKSLSDISYAYNIIANIYSAMGDIKEAIKQFENALSVCEEINDYPGISMCYYNLGSSLAFLPDFDKSNYYFLKSIEVNEKMHNKFSLVQDHFMIGNNKLQTKELDPALEYLEKSVQLYDEKMGREDVYGLCFSRIAETQIYKNDLSQAEINMDKSLELLSKIDEMPDALAQAKIVLVELYIKQGKLVDAESLCSSLEKEFSEINIPELQIHVMKQHANVYFLKKEYDKSRVVLQKAMSIAKDIGAEYEQYSVELFNYNIDIDRNDQSDDMYEKVSDLKNKLEDYKIWQDLELADSMLRRLRG